MATRGLLYLGGMSHKCLFTTVQYPNARLQFQSSWKQARGFRRNRDTSKHVETNFNDAAAGATTLSYAKLWKPLGFTVAVSGVSLVGACIWEYEKLSKYANRIFNRYNPRRVKHTGWRAELEIRWKSLTQGQRVFAPILFLNVIVFLGWRIPMLKNVMVRYFCSNPSSNVTCWPMLLSTFSHHSALHLAANMYVLHSFSGLAVATLGKEQFVAFYLTSGVVSSLTSYLYKTMFGLPGLSLGASGAIMGILSFVCLEYPNQMLSLAFLWTFTAGTAIKGILALDAVGCVLKWRFMDHAAHLGGALYGIFWQSWGNQNIWQKREPIVKFWHSIRQPTGTK